VAGVKPVEDAVAEPGKSFVHEGVEAIREVEGAVVVGGYPSSARVCERLEERCPLHGGAVGGGREALTSCPCFSVVTLLSGGGSEVGEGGAEVREAWEPVEFKP